MAFLVLFSTVSVTVEKHYCKDHLVDVAVFGKAKKCGSDNDILSYKSLVKSCCDDVLEVYRGQDKLQKADYNFELEQPSFITKIIVFNYQIENTSIIVNTLLPQHYIPPNPEINIQVLHQSFLI